MCVCEGILSLCLPPHSPARGNAIPPLCKLTAYTHAETPDLGLRRRFQRGMILINSRCVLLLRPIANKLEKKKKKTRNKMYVQISLVTGTQAQSSTGSIHRNKQLRRSERQISHEVSICMTYCDVMWTNLFFTATESW